MGNLYDTQEVHTVYTYPLNGTLREFNIPFEYLARKFVRVTLIGENRRVLVLKDDYRFATKSVIQTNKAWGPADGYNSIEIRRHTSSVDRLVEFTDGSILRAYDMNVSEIQTLHVAEEARESGEDDMSVDRDGNFNAKGRRISNVGNAMEDQDAVTWGQVKDLATHGAPHAEEAKKAAAEAKKSRDEAWSFKNQASTSKDEAVAAARSALQVKTEVSAFTDQAKAARDTAVNAAAQAGAFSASAGTASTSAQTYSQESQKWADKAKEEADKILAGGGVTRLMQATSEIRDDQTVIWKGRHEFVGTDTGRAVTLHNAPDEADGPIYIEARLGDKPKWYIGSSKGQDSALRIHNYDDSSISISNDEITVTNALRVQHSTQHSRLKSDGDIEGNIWRDKFGASTGLLSTAMDNLSATLNVLGEDTAGWFYKDHSSGLILMGTLVDHTLESGSGAKVTEWIFPTPFPKGCLAVIPVKIAQNEEFAKIFPFIVDYDMKKCTYYYENGTQTNLLAIGH